MQGRSGERARRTGRGLVQAFHHTYLARAEHPRCFGLIGGEDHTHPRDDPAVVVSRVHPGRQVEALVP